MANETQTLMLADIRMIKQHQKEQDKKIASLEAKESVNGTTILKAISELTKETRENYKDLSAQIQEIREDNKSLHEELQRVNGKMDLIIKLISKKK